MPSSKHSKRSKRSRSRSRERSHKSHKDRSRRSRSPVRDSNVTNNENRQSDRSSTHEKHTERSVVNRTTTEHSYSTITGPSNMPLGPNATYANVHNVANNETVDNSNASVSWNTVKNNELEHLRNYVKNHQEFSFCPSEIHSMGDFSEEGEIVEQSKEVVSQPMEPQGDLSSILFAGSHEVPKGKPLGALSLKLVDDWFAKDVDSDYIKSLREMYVEPENTEHLSSKNMNSEIYRNLNESVRKRDFILKAAQANITAAAVASCRMIDVLLDENKDKLPKELAAALAQHVASNTKLLAKASSDISMVRKQCVKPYLDPKYSILCAQRCYTKNLFGEDLTKTLKEADELSKLTKSIAVPNKMSNKFRQQQYQQYKSYQQYQPQAARGRGSFSQRGQRPYQRGRYNNNKKPATQAAPKQ